MVITLDGQETQVLDDYSNLPGPNSPMNEAKVCEESNCAMNKDKICEELNCAMNKDKVCEEAMDEEINNILFGETQALDDPYDWDNKTQLYCDTQALEDPGETQLYDETTQVLEGPAETQLYDETQAQEDPVGTRFTQVPEDPVGTGIETQLIEDMGSWIETQLVEGHDEEDTHCGEREEREREGLEERERKEFEEREGEERERECLEERERKELEERERKELEEKGEERENLIEGCEERESLVDSDASTDDEACGSIHKRLTSLRVASVRCSTLAANSNFNSKLNTSDRNNPLNQEKYNIETKNDELLSARNYSRQSNNKMVRQLFADVAPEVDRTGSSVPVLSYVESQEPSILSQANALELVDKLIASNDVGPTQDINNNKISNNSSINNNNNNNNNNNISAKLVQLVKNMGPTSPAQKKQIFDWNNLAEDEGGGEFFKKNKDLLIEKSRGGQVKSVPPKGRERKMARDLHLGRSDSRVILNKTEMVCGENTRKILFDERENDGEVLEREDGEVGPDTQVAVEAIQELVHGSPGRPGPSKGRKRIDELVGERVSDNIRKTRSASTKIAQETTERAGTRSGKSVLQEGRNVKSAKKRKEVSKHSPGARLLDLSENSKKREGNFEKADLEIFSVGRITRSCSKTTELLGQNVITPNNSGQTAKCKKRRTSYTISPSNSEKKKRIFIRSATELLDKAKRQKRVYSDKTEEESILFDKENDKNSTKISTQSRVINEKSPVFSPQKSGRKTLYKPSVCRELLGLQRTEKQVVKKWKDLRVRKDFTSAKVLLSNHLDDNIIKQQKRLGVLEASNMQVATHFVADKFVRTRNMLEAIAMGKYVVTPVWLERCNLSNQYVDEKNFILRDTKKEKEIGFCMTNSLAIASNSPLLKGKRVVITLNVKPSQEVVMNLVLASGGQPMERIGRSLTKEQKITEDILVISCEEDYETCIPLLEKGGGIFSSELVLNGIIIQKLEFERHRLFSDHVKRTRSTIWLRDKQAGKFVPVTKCT